jgi:hypothetical protein
MFSINIPNERVQSIERVFILYSSQRTFNKKKSFIHVQKEKKIAAYSFTVNCLPMGLSVDTSDESFFFLLLLFAYLKK